MTDKQLIENLLARLSDDPCEVASRLVQENCFGMMADENRCCIAKYIKKYVPDCIFVISNHCIRMVNIDESLSAPFIFISLPPAVKRFMHLFDLNLDFRFCQSDKQDKEYVKSLKNY